MLPGGRGEPQISFIEKRSECAKRTQTYRGVNQEVADSLSVLYIA